jgi:hypothetical protein
MLWVGFTASAHETKLKDPVRVVSSRMDVFYFKLDKKFVGADLEIYSQDGVKILSQKIVRRKVLVDFYYENKGRYVIHLQKGEVVKEFDFIKAEACPEVEKPAQLITIKQGI